MIQEIKERIDCVQVAQLCNLSIKKSGDRCSSFLHAGSNPNSMIVTTDYFYSFSDSIGGDCIDLLALHSYDGDKGKAIQYLAQITGVQLYTPKSDAWIKYTENLNNTIQLWHTELLKNDDNLKYLYDRKINDKTIKELKIGYNEKSNRIIIPMWKNGYICYYIGRTLVEVTKENPKYLKPKLNEYLENDIHGLTTLSRNSDKLIIAEGAFDYLSFYQENFSVIATCGGNFSKQQLKRVISICKNYNEVILVFDNDNSGNKFTINMAKLLFSNRISFRIVHIPKPHKDTSDYYCAGGNLQTLVNTAIDGITELCTMFDNDEEFENFIRKASQYLRKTDIIKIFSNKKLQKFDVEWLKVLKSECTKPPLDESIARSIITNHDILFNPKLGFYEYNGKHWESVTDDYIGKYIHEELGIYTTGSKIASIKNTIKPLVLSTAVMNKKPIMNFVNGTLEIETGNFRAHNKIDNVNYVLNYPYDPTIGWEQWSEFISSIADNDDKKTSLLQELAGYVLFPDNILQKAAFFVGNGSNGKSVYLNTLMKVFGFSNISNIEITSFNEDFQVISLIDSLLNIATEVKTSVESCESKFKQIVTGDPIRACYKGKDYIDFVPRAKLFFACNDLPKITDYSDGFKRRMCIVNFPLKFVETPKASNERPINKNLESLFSTPQSLSGIFNWVYLGYKLISTVGYFTETEDQKELMEDFDRTINPILNYIDEFEFPEGKDIMTSFELYQDYRSWCDANGYRTKNSNNFYKSFRDGIKLRKDIEPFRTNKLKGYRKSSGADDVALRDVRTS